MGCRVKGFFVSSVSGSQSLGRLWRAELFSLLIGVNKSVRGNIGRVLTWVGVAFSSFIVWWGATVFCSVVAFSSCCWSFWGGVYLGLVFISSAVRLDAS